MGGDSLESIEQLLDMSDIDREKHLTPFRFLFFISEVLFNGALSEAQLVPCVHDDLKCLGRFYFNKDVDDLTPYNGGWFNLSKGNGNENYFNVVGHRAEMTKRLIMNLIPIACKRDSDPDLKDELASFLDMSAKEHFSVHEDHEGGKNCKPSDLPTKGLVFMLNEIVSYLLPMKAITHDARTANQNAYAKAKGIKKSKLCMIERNFDKHFDQYSDARKASLTAYKNVD